LVPAVTYLARAPAIAFPKEVPKDRRMPVEPWGWGSAGDAAGERGALEEGLSVDWWWSLLGAIGAVAFIFVAVYVVGLALQAPDDRHDSGDGYGGRRDLR
jgi:hypothetical protein